MNNGVSPNAAQHDITICLVPLVLIQDGDAVI